MEGFDREALVKSTEAKQKGGVVFWSSVAALPVAGIAAGLFMMGTGGPSTPASPQTVTAEASKPQMVAMAAPEAPEAVPEFSARGQLQTYAMTVTTLRACAETGPTEHYNKARQAYYDRNFEKTAALREVAVTEGPNYDMSAFEKEIPTDPAEIMLQGMTGQIAVNALQRQAQFTAMMKEMDSDARRVGQGYLGPEPDAIACTNFRNDLIRGKYDIELPPKG